MKTYTLRALPKLNGVSSGAINGEKVFTDYNKLVDFCVNQTTSGLALSEAKDVEEEKIIDFLKNERVELVIEVK